MAKKGGGEIPGTELRKSDCEHSSCRCGESSLSSSTDLTAWFRLGRWLSSRDAKPQRNARAPQKRRCPLEICKSGESTMLARGSTFSRVDPRWKGRSKDRKNERNKRLDQRRRGGKTAVAVYRLSTATRNTSSSRKKETRIFINSAFQATARASLS